MVREHIQSRLQSILADMGVSDVVPDVSVSADPIHGDYTSNVAMRLAKSLKRSPMEIALQVKSEWEKQSTEDSHKSGDQITKQKDHNVSEKTRTENELWVIEKIEVAPPGFLNVFLTEANLSTVVDEVLKVKERFGTTKSKIPLDLLGEADGEAERIMVEFAHPNTHKAFHIGHLRNITTGESIVRLLEASGHTVIRVNYQGDVGMHIAKCLWAMINLSEFDHASVADKDIHARVEFLGKAYAAGSQRYEADATVKAETAEINKKIYAKDSSVYPLYQETRAWSLEYFSGIYARVGTTYDRLYFESEFYEKGKAFVREGIAKQIFTESDGAVIFPGEKYGLHTRVFITKEGNATYEGKEIGLGRAQFDEYHPDLVMHVVGPEQAGYFQVLFEALARMFPETKHREYHKIYGWVKLKHGKMSSRTGQVVLGEWLLDEAKKSIYEILSQNKSEYTKEETDEIAEKGAVAAVKYAFLKVSTNQEIAFDLKESVSFDGDSGPYLLYTYARCMSVLRKAGAASSGEEHPMEADERLLARSVSFFPDIVAEAAHALAPNVLCTYLFRLAQTFNGFYHTKTIAGNNRRMALTAAAAQTLRNGLYLLGIQTVERM